VVALEIPQREPCPYCENFAGRFAWHGPPASIAEGDQIFVFLAPASLGGMEGHTLVTTRRHVETILDLTADEETALMRAVANAARALTAALDPDGILVQQHNGTAAFQTVPHIHFHVVPKRADSPFPPTHDVPVTPNEDRVLLAEVIRGHWPD
jgi:histidine triad (HIT) family protein